MTDKRGLGSEPKTMEQSGAIEEQSKPYTEERRIAELEAQAEVGDANMLAVQAYASRMERERDKATSELAAARADIGHMLEGGTAGCDECKQIELRQRAYEDTYLREAIGAARERKERRF